MARHRCDDRRTLWNRRCDLFDHSSLHGRARCVQLDRRLRDGFNESICYARRHSIGTIGPCRILYCFLARTFNGLSLSTNVDVIWNSHQHYGSIFCVVNLHSSRSHRLVLPVLLNFGGIIAYFVPDLCAIKNSTSQTASLLKLIITNRRNSKWLS